MNTKNPSRNRINYSDKLDKEVEKFSDDGDNWKLRLDVAGCTTYGDNDTNGTMEGGFSIGLGCPPDKMVWSGYSETDNMRYYVYAKDEKDAVKAWKAAVKAAKAAFKKSKK